MIKGNKRTKNRVGATTSPEQALAKVFAHISLNGMCVIRSKTTFDNEPTWQIVARHFDYDIMSRVAEMLSAEDIIVEYVPGCNFLTLKGNPTPTPAKEVPTIFKIPASLEDVPKLIASDNDMFSVIYEFTSGHTRATVICKDSSNMHELLSEAAYTLSHRGLSVKFINDSNFLIVESAVEYSMADSDEVITSNANVVAS